MIAVQHIAADVLLPAAPLLRLPHRVRFALQWPHLGDVLAAAHVDVHAERVADAFGAFGEEGGDGWGAEVGDGFAEEAKPAHEVGVG